MKYHFQTQKDILTCNAHESKPKHNVHKTTKMYKHKKKKTIKTHKNKKLEFQIMKHDL